MPVMTKNGDFGSTKTLNKSLSKGSELIETLGSLDELIATMILLQARYHINFKDRVSEIVKINAYLAGSSNPLELNKAILEMEAFILIKQIPFTNFVYPFEDETKAALNHLRTVVRRAERVLIRLHDKQALPDDLIIYMNRLSDYVFVQE
jgi:cob(I)alamin adenosyltransferase